MSSFQVLAFVTLFFVASPVQAQVIDLFDGQEKMDAAPVQIGTVGQETTFEEAGTQGTQSDGGITIRFERKDNSIMVPATIRGKTIYFLFDTGATFTTLTSAFAKSVGLKPKKDYPVGMSQTANGALPMQFGLIDRITLGGRPHSNVSFSVCDACPSGFYKGKPIVGLLGLNVIGRYRYSVDEGAGKISMYPHSAYNERIRDVRPWVNAIDQNAVRVDNRSVKHTVVVKNVAPVSVRELGFVFQCGNGKTFPVKKSVSARGTRAFSKTFKTDECPGLRFEISSARW